MMRAMTSRPRSVRAARRSGRGVSSLAAMPLRVLALIPARSGSKGLRHKNVRLLDGEPLLTRAVALARESARRGEVWSVVVSTESRRYARIAAAAGAEVPFVRPAALARDDTRLTAVVHHAIATLAGQGRRFDVVLLLSPTTPLTRVADVRGAMSLFRASRGAAVLSVTPEQVAPSWRFTLRGGRLVAPADRRVGRRQEATPTYVLNGALYVATPVWLARHGQFWAPGARAYVMPKERSLDIESAFDLEVARGIVGGGRSGGSG